LARFLKYSHNANWTFAVFLSSVEAKFRKETVMAGGLGSGLYIKAKCWCGFEGEVEVKPEEYQLALTTTEAYRDLSEQHLRTRCKLRMGTWKTAGPSYRHA
jgi:hypothetical protein